MKWRSFWLHKMVGEALCADERLHRLILADMTSPIVEGA